MKTPAIVDQSVPLNGSSAYIITPPRPEPPENGCPTNEYLYDVGIQKISHVNIFDGKMQLKDAYHLGNIRAGQALAYWYPSQDGSGNPITKHLSNTQRELVRKEYATAMSDYAFAYQLGQGVKKSRIWPSMLSADVMNTESQSQKIRRKFSSTTRRLWSWAPGLMPSIT